MSYEAIPVTVRTLKQRTRRRGAWPELLKGLEERVRRLGPEETIEVTIEGRDWPAFKTTMYRYTTGMSYRKFRLPEGKLSIHLFPRG